jgi:hypothetical protein
LALHPHDLATQQQLQFVLQDRDDIGGEAPVGAAAEVGDVDRDAAPRLELADTFGEHLGQHPEVFLVARRDVALAECGLVVLAGEVRRRGHDQRDR